MAPMNWTALSALAAAAAAVAAMVNGWWQRRSAMEIARLNLIMPMREAWIGQLREKIARYITGCAKVNVDRKFDWEPLLLRHEIALMLNPNEEEHRQLEESLTGLVRLAEERAMDDPEVGRAVQETRRLATSILRAEWQRAKRGQ